MPATTTGRPRARRLAGPAVARLLALIALVVAACGTISTTPPPATPTDFPGLTNQLAGLNVRPSDWVSGDAGCTDPDLVPSAISFQARGLDQATPVKVYLYIFRDDAAFQRHRAQIGPCAKSYVTDPGAYQEIEQSPFILAGQGPWGPRFEAALRQALAAGAGSGG